jgi:hypothetical protein
MELLLVYKISGLIIFAYLLGSIPFGLLLTRYFSSVNILEQGSGNIGATNVRPSWAGHYPRMRQWVFMVRILMGAGIFDW